MIVSEHPTANYLNKFTKKRYDLWKTINNSGSIATMASTAETVTLTPVCPQHSPRSFPPISFPP